MTAQHFVILRAVIVLQFLLARALFRAGHRRLPVAAFYMTAFSFAALMNAGALLMTAAIDSNYSVYGEVAGAIRIAFAFSALAWLATEAVPDRRRTLLAVAAPLVICGTLAAPEMPHIVNFSAALANIVVWFGLVTNRPFDTTKLLLASGLGIQLAGGALGAALARMHPAAASAGAVFAVGSDLVCLLIWFHAIVRVPITSRVPE